LLVNVAGAVCAPAGHCCAGGGGDGQSDLGGV